MRGRRAWLGLLLCAGAGCVDGGSRARLAASNASSRIRSPMAPIAGSSTGTARRMNW